MSFTAINKMREFNEARFGKEVGPFSPAKHFDEKSFALKDAALRFIHNRCEALNFDYDKEEQENKEGVFLGKSIEENQIPYNMQMDLNRLCLERELEKFIDSGVAEDAYNVYYCYMEMFFGHYGKSKKMVELLSEFESNGSSLLMKHRDHYSHSVYVFSLGLAMYETNSLFRSAFKKYYGYDTDETNVEADHKAACFFLEYWGLTSLFHDIGYPFELPFEQVLSYFEVDNKKRGEGKTVFLAYKDVSAMTELSEKVKERLKTLYGKDFNSTNELFAFDLSNKLTEKYGFSEENMLDTLNNKPVSPESFGYYMDHAWFSATRLLQELVSPVIIKIKHEDGTEEVKEDYSGINKIEKTHIDALTAILMHNSLYKFMIAGNYTKRLKPVFTADNHPLAWLLMLCDELQCWDRTAYGRNSRSELHPMSALFDFSDNNIKAVYIYDEDESDKISRYKDKYKDYLEKLVNCLEKGIEDKPEPPSLKAFSSMYQGGQSFRTDIENIVDVNREGTVQLTVSVKTAPVDFSSKHTYLSGSNFLHLYDFAVSLHSRHYLDREEDAKPEVMEREFEKMSLEYKLSNINRAKNFGKYLNAINCFYTDKPVDFNIVHAFTPEDAAIFAPMEHERWIMEHQWMGWRFGEYYLSEEALKAVNKKYDSKQLREQLRVHKLAMDGKLTSEDISRHYDQLTDRDQGKDWKPFNSMLKLLKKYDGVRIYKLK